MKLNLERPIIFLDLETTGVSVLKDRIVELSLVKVMPDGSTNATTLRFNPGVHIPEETTAVHHITDADVATMPSFAEKAAEIAEMLTGCDIAGYNSSHFDVPLLSEEFTRAGLTFDFRQVRFIDVQTIYHKREPRTLSAAYAFYCGGNLEDAHSAEADAMATYRVLLGQLERYPDLQNDIDALSKYSSHHENVDLMGRMIYDDQHREVVNFGQHKGKLVEDVLTRQPGFLQWVMEGDFPSDTKRILQAIHLRMVQRRKQQKPKSESK